MAEAQVAAPVFSRAQAYYAVSLPVSISCVTPNAAIHYTLNGNEPTINDPLLASGGTVLISKSLTLKAKAWVGNDSSLTASADYVITGALSIGGAHTLMIKPDGALVAAGMQDAGRLANGATAAANVSSFLASYKSAGVVFPNAEEVSAGANHSLVLDSGKIPWAFGSNSSGQLGDNTTTQRAYPVRILKSSTAGDYLPACSQIAAGDRFSLALSQAGNVYAWGLKTDSRMGNGSTGTSEQKTAVLVTEITSSNPALSQIKGIAAGSAFGFARKAHAFELAGGTGTLWAWGLNANGQLGIGSTSNASRATLVKLNATTNLTDVLDVSAGVAHTAVLRWKNGTSPIMGEVWTFGLQADGRLGNGLNVTANVSYPVQVKKSASVALDHIIQISAGPRHTLALDDSGNVWSWGSNGSGELGNGTGVASPFANKVKHPSGTGDLTGIVLVVAGGNDGNGTSYAVGRDGTIYAWGANSNGQMGRPTGSKTWYALPRIVPGTAFWNRTPQIKLGLNQPDLAVANKVRLVASIADLDGADDVQNVSFYQGSTLLATKTASPWIHDMEALVNGAYSDINAVITDSQGNTAISSPLSFNIPFSEIQVTAPSLPDWDLDGIKDTNDHGGLGDWSMVTMNDVEADPDGRGLGAASAVFLNDPGDRLLGRWDFESGSVSSIGSGTSLVLLPASHPSAGPFQFTQTSNSGCVWDGNSAPPVNNGIPGRGVHFSRQDAYGQLKATDFDKEEDQTWTMWIKFEPGALDPSSAIKTLFSQGAFYDSTTTTKFPLIHCYFDRNDQKLKLATYSGGTETVRSSWLFPANLDDGNWHHIGVAFYDESNGSRFWCDGVRINGSEGIPSNFVLPLVQNGGSPYVLIGKMMKSSPSNKNEQKLNASIDRLRIYDGGQGSEQKLSTQNLVDLYYQDADQDGLWDRTEMALNAGDAFYWQDPARDRDKDGLADIDEQTRGTQIANMDTDGDGLPDGWEVTHGYNPLNSGDSGIDADGDGIPNQYERQHGLSLINDDSLMDKDNDGLSNLLEYQIGTDVSSYDTDHDLLPDAFEYANGCLNPKVAETYSVGGVTLAAKDGDPDNDGLTNLEEYIQGTKPCLPDSDNDAIHDGDEVYEGSDPLDNLDKPFDPEDYLGEPINDANVAPIGNLGVIYQGSPQDYSINGEFGDDSDSHSERWSLNFSGKRNINKVNREFGEMDDFSINLDRNYIWDVTISHVGTNGDENNPDYDYNLHLESTPGFIFIDTVNSGLFLADENTPGIVGDFSIEDNSPDYWKTKLGYLIPTKSSSYSSSYSGGDAVGPRYRKIALNGRPLPDEKPEQEEETEVQEEETYVDAYDLSLHHDTSFISVPLGSSDLILEANASSRETMWSNRGGLRPQEELTSPFGVGWSSNLCAYIEVTQTLEKNPTDPISVNAVDETGRGQRFATNNLQTFQPWPSSRVDKKTYLNQLVRNGNNLVLQKKFGNKLTYAPCKAWFLYSTDRVEGSEAVVKHTYWRLIRVEDRYGNTLDYNYGNSEVSLIPEQISAGKHPGQNILINRSADGRRIESITDPRGNTVSFSYAISSVSNAATINYTTLTGVSYADGTSQHYTYEGVGYPESVDGKITDHYHVNLKTISDKIGNTHTFNYVADWSKYAYSANGSGRTVFAVSDEVLEATLSSAVMAEANRQLEGMNETPSTDEQNIRVQFGNPRRISSIILPGANGTSTFAKSQDTHTFYGKSFSAASGTEVTDVMNHKTFYDFDGLHGEIVDLDHSVHGDSTAVGVEWMIYYTSMKVYHGGKPGSSTAGSWLGTETFEYDLDSGLSLSRMIDFSGNETIWHFDNPLPTGSVVQLAGAPGFMSKWADPTSKEDALGRRETYQYGEYRVMSESVDVHGIKSSTAVDGLGRRTSLVVTDSSNTSLPPLKQEIYQYGNAAFPGFMTRKTLKAFSNLSGKSWEQDMVTEYTPDDKGRIWKETVDPGGLNLQTVYTYDLNNNKLTATDPKEKTTSFKYDSLNRIYQIDHPATQTEYGLQTSSTINYFDANGNRAMVQDENGNKTIYQRDALNRVVTVIRDMDGSGIPAWNSYHIISNGALNNEGVSGADDLVTHTQYNGVSYPVRKTDARGFCTVTFTDALQRPLHVFAGVPTGNTGDFASLQTLAASSRSVSHTELSYEQSVSIGGINYITSPGSSGFSSEGFKPTKSIRHGAVRENVTGDDSSFTTVAVYDEVYRPIAVSENFNSTAQGEKRTITAYGDIVNYKEALVSTTTDARGKITESETDGLGRTIRVTEAKDTALAGVSHSYYSSTGLLWKTVDELGRITEMEYDKAGRMVLIRQPDPVTGTITANSPILQKAYDRNGNVVSVIDPLTRQTDTAYDERNRPWKVEQPAVTNAIDPENPVANVRPTTTTYYDLAGNVVLSVDPLGAGSRKFYDRANRAIASRQNPVALSPSATLASPGAYDITTTSILDKGGLVLASTDGNGNITRNAYDALGRLIATIADPADGNPADPNDPAFDPATHRTGSTSEILVTNLYDDAGNLIEVMDGKGQRTGFTYDGQARRTRTLWDEGSAGERVEQFTFDGLVQLTRIDPKGQLTSFQYDALNRLSDVLYTGASADNRHLAYDLKGNLLAVTYPNETAARKMLREVTQVFDKLNRLTEETSAGATHVHTLDKAGNRTTTTYAGTGRHLTNTYDELNRLVACVEKASVGASAQNITSYFYDLNGNVTRKVLPNGTATNSTFDALNRKLGEVTTKSGGGLVSSFDYSQPTGGFASSHDNAGNLLKIVEAYGDPSVKPRNVTNTYDRAYRLTREVAAETGGSTVTTDYAYDAGNNRTGKIVTGGSNPGTSTFVYGTTADGYNSNQLKSVTKGASVTTFSYDANGNRTLKQVGGITTQSYSFDYENRLIGLTDGTGTYGYTYDHRTRRVGRNESAAGGVNSELSFAGGLSVQEYTSGSSLPNVETIRGSDYGGGIGGVLYTIRSGARSYNAYNSRGDVVSKTDDGGAITWQSSYEAFGTRTQENGSTQDRQKANTKDEDPTGLLNEGMRYRDLEFGAFLTRDPAGFVDGPNVYTYVRQNPWSAFDPDGLTTATWEAPVFGGAVTTVVGGLGRFAAQMATGLRAVSSPSVAGTAAAAATTSGGVTYSSSAAGDAKKSGISVARTAWQQGRITKEQYVEIAEGVINSQAPVAGMYQGAAQAAGNQVVKQVEEKIANAVEANNAANAGAAGNTARTQQVASQEEAQVASGSGGSDGNKEPEDKNKNGKEERNPADDKKYGSDKEADRAARELGYKDAHELKKLHKANSKQDMFRGKDGNTYLKPKDGSGPGERVYPK